jgi:hypothetical protein
LNLNFLSKQADLKPGQKVYTSGVGGVFPVGFADWQCENVSVCENWMGKRISRPAVDLSHLDDVFVVTGRNDFLFCFTLTCADSADCGVFYSSAAVALQRPRVHRTGDCLLRRNGTAVSSHAGACLYAGILLDAVTVQVIGGKVEISTGSSILIYGVLAGVMHGLRPLFAARALGSALHPEWCLHLVNSSGAIFDDYISSRLYRFHPRNLVADRRAWSRCHGDGPDPVLVLTMDGTGYCLLLST